MTELPRLFLDSSVIIAGCGSYRGASRAVLTLGELRLLQLVVCPFVFREVERNLVRNVPEATPYFGRIRDSIIWEIAADPIETEARKWISVVPPKDAPVLAAAVACRPDRFITLDTRHFLRLPDVAVQSGLAIQTPAQALGDIRRYLTVGYGTR